jgi:hypothetical protein
VADCFRDHSCSLDTAFHNCVELSYFLAQNAAL